MLKAALKSSGEPQRVVDEPDFDLSIGDVTEVGEVGGSSSDDAVDVSLDDFVRGAVGSLSLVWEAQVELLVV
jgi:hypothetical protein